MNGREFLRRVHHWLGLLPSPVLEDMQPGAYPRWSPALNSAAYRDSEEQPSVRSLRERRRRRGFLASEVGISMYLGTRGVRGL